jgi:predicted homoserine dehydrogenase-like protein
VALLGLGRIGSQFATGLADHIAQGSSPIKIVAVAEANPDSEAAAKFKTDGVTVYTDAMGVIEMGVEVDVIFDLTGIPEVRQSLRDDLRAAGNRHTVIVPEVMVRMLWSFLENAEDLSGPVREGY